GVQRVAVAAEAVEQRLLRQGRGGDVEIRCPVGEFGLVTGAAFTAETAFAAGEDGGPFGPQGFAVGAGDGEFLHDHRVGTLVPDLADPAGAGRFTRGGQRPVHLDF